MSKDIRLYFQKKPQKAKIEDDDDVIPESPDVQIIKNKKKEVKKRRIVDDDSDEEIFATKKKKSDISEASKKSKDKLNKAPLKEVKAIDIFGSAPIKRTEPIVKKQKKNTEIGIHSDEEFEKSLLEIDNVELEDKSVNNKSKTDDTSHTDITKPSTSNATTEKTKSNSETAKDKKHKHNKESEAKTDKKTKNHDKTNIESDKVVKNKSEKDDKISKTKIDGDKRNGKRSESEEMSNIKKDSHEAVKTEKKSHQSTSDNVNNEDKKSKTDKSKRKFAEFLETSNHDSESSKKKKLNDNNEFKTCDTKQVDADLSIIDSSFVEDDGKKKKRHNKSLNESVLTDEERHERRIQSAALYKSYLNRSGPKHLGAKEIPEGTPDCLRDCAFVVTGVLDSFEKEEITAAINKFGGSVKSGVTKKVTHVLAGEDAGPKKMATAQELGIKIINEDEFLQMIRDLSNKKSHDKLDKSETKKDKSPNKKSKDKDTSHSNKSEKDRKGNHVDDKAKKNSEKKSESKPSKVIKMSESSSSHKSFKSKSPKKVKLEIKEDPSTEIKSEEIGTSNKQVNGVPEKDINTANALMWVEKYKPQNIKQIIGQHGDASNVKKLMNWLTKWYVNRKAKLTKPSPWAKNDDGAFFKAALLSGPPGVGKTTTVGLVCKELGFDMVEFNASDTRNKTLIKEQIGELLTTTSLSGYAQGKTGKQAVTKKHVLVMDEVDGMAGNEDRGGLQELIGLIKSTSVPIICMCNDRNSQKMRSLANYTYDLRFSRPRVDQIKSAMMSICFKEGIKIPPDVLAQLIASANQDVRQTLNLLSMWAVEPSLADADRLRADAKISKKDVKLGPWEAIRKVFSAEDHKSMTIHDKSDLFFYDYSLAPLFVQENYLQVAPHCPKHEVLQRISEAADSISLGDLVDARIRGSQAWSLLPLQAMYSSVIPGHAMSGHMSGQIQFPGWLGKNSRANKMHRLCQEIHAHTRLSTSGSKSSIFLDYASHLRDAITAPLIKDKMDGISQALDVLESYHLLREDLDSLVELSVWPGQRSPTVLIDSKVKAAMTRTYNKKATALPYAPGAVKKVRAKEDSEDVEEEPDTEDAEDSDPENDALIKKSKSKDTVKASTSKAEKTSAKPSTSKKKKEK